MLGLNIVPLNLLSFVINTSNFNIATTYSLLILVLLSSLVLLSLNKRSNKILGQLFYFSESGHRFHKINSGTYIFTSILIGILFFLLFIEKTAFEWATTGEINSVIRLANGDFILEDFYTNAVISSPKIIFNYFIYFLSLLGIDWSEAFFLLKLLGIVSIHCLLFFLFIRVLRFWNYAIFDRFEEEIKSFIFIFLLIQLVASQFLPKLSPFGWSEVQFFFAVDPMRLAFIAGLLYLILSFSDKNLLLPRLSLLFFSSIVHPVIGLCNFILSAILLLTKKLSKERVIEFVAILFVSVFFPIFLLSFFFDQGSYLNATEFYRIYIELRHPHHYKISNVLNSYSVLWVTLLAIHVLIAIYTNNKELIRLTIVTLFAMLLSVLAQFLFSEVFPNKTIMKAGPNRFTAYLSILWSINSLILITFFLDSSLYDRLRHNFLYKLSLSAGNMTNKILSKFNTLFHKNWLSYCAVALIIFSSYLLTYKDPKERFDDGSTIETLNWLNINTPEDSVIFGVHFDSALIRIFAERSVYADFMFPFNEKFMREFEIRYDFYQRTKRYSLSDFACLENPEFDYLILRNKNTDASLSAFATQKWLIFDLSKLNCQL